MTFLLSGGGIAGASLAKVMADEGAKVLVLERESRFKDRVRGEGIHPWGVAELKRLGLYDTVSEYLRTRAPVLDQLLQGQGDAPRIS